MTDGTEVAATPPPAGGNGKERRLRLLLIASVAVNLLVIGAIVGTALTWKRHGWRHGGLRGEDFGLMALTRSMPAERRDPIRKALRQERAKLRPLWDDVGAARLEAAGVLGAEPFDRARLKDAIGKIAEAEGKLKAAGVETFLDAAEQLTSEERKELSDRWRKRAERHASRRARDRSAPPVGKEKDGVP